MRNFATQFEDNPRSFAIELTEMGVVSPNKLLLCCIKYMSHDDVRDMLDANELSPRFDEDEEYELETVEDARDAFWDDCGDVVDQGRNEEWSQNDYNADTRMTFVVWVDSAHRGGRMSDDIADYATLGDAD